MENSSAYSLDQYESSVTEVPLNNQARSMSVSFNKIIQSLSQTPISSIRLKLQLASSFAQGRYQGQSSLIDMPPHTVKHVIMNVKRMGRGPLPDFDFDEVAEE